MFYNAKTKKVKALNGSGRSPAALNLDIVRKSGIIKQKVLPRTNINSVTVPGAAAAWYDAVKEWGSGKVSFDQIMTPAIRLAEEGVPTTEINSHLVKFYIPFYKPPRFHSIIIFQWRQSEELIKSASPNGTAMLLNGRAPHAGEIMRFPELANTFKLLVRNGKSGFYGGIVAESIVDLISSKGGVMTMEDLASHESTFVDPISITYKGVTLYEVNPNFDFLSPHNISESQLSASGSVHPMGKVSLR